MYSKEEFRNYNNKQPMSFVTYRNAVANFNPRRIDVCPANTKNDNIDKYGVNKSENFFTLTFYFTFGYYLGIIPFKPTYNQAKAKWQMKVWRPQQIGICLCLVRMSWWTYNVTRFPKLIIRLIQAESGRTSKTYFLILRHLLSILRVGKYTWILHTSREDIEDAFNAVTGSEIHFPLVPPHGVTRRREKRCIFYKRICIAIVVTYLVPTIIRQIINIASLSNGKLVSPERLFLSLVRGGRRRFWMDPGDRNSEYSTGDILLGILEVWLRTTHYVMHFMYMETFFLVILPLTFWAAARNFEDFVDEEIEESNMKDAEDEKSNDASKKCEHVMRVVDAFTELKNFSGHMNSTWASLNLIWVLDNAMRIVFMYNSKFDIVNAFSVITIVLQFVWWVFQMWACGDVYRKMSCTKVKIQDWKNERTLMLGEHEEGNVRLSILLDQMERESVGIGTQGVYKSTYGFISQLLVVGITLFIVSFDSSSEPEENDKSDDT